MLRVLLVSISMLLATCASVPLSTMLTLSAYDKEDVWKLDPSQIQARILIQEPGEIDIDKVQMSFELNEHSGVRLFKFPLRLISELKKEAEGGLFFSSPAATEYTFEFADEAITNFLRVKSSLSAKDQQSKVSFSVGTGFKPVPEGTKELTLSIYLKLSEKHEFLTLIDEGKLSLAPKPAD